MARPGDLARIIVVIPSPNNLSCDALPIPTAPAVGWRPVGGDHRLTEDALEFGGPTATVTDLAVAGGLASIGDATRARTLGDDVGRRGLVSVRERLESMVDQLKLSADPLPLVLLGGGNIIVGDTLTGAANVRRPEHVAVANAIGAAMAKAGGYVERVFLLDDVS